MPELQVLVRMSKYTLKLHSSILYSPEIRFKNQGLDSIEVHDNGGGITPDNYETVALKHYTSKLNTYDDLGTLDTFGFRGEALSSLCALSSFKITTCTAEQAPKGTKLEFETSGKLKNTSMVAASKGTTVSIKNLFKNLPVRRQELQRNIKREWTKVINVVGQYASIQTDVKIKVTHQPLKGRKTVIFSTKGNKTTRENIANVFGAKTLTALVPLDLVLELEPSVSTQKRSKQQDDDAGDGKTEIHITGHISRPVSGEGRQTPDKQMFFVNARPCGLPQVSKVFNEVYKSFNNNQSPFIFANIELDTHLYDVNVSPDKRTIMLHEQGKMLEQLRIELTSMFEKEEYSVPVSQMGTQMRSVQQKQTMFRQLTIDRQDLTPSMTFVPKVGEDEAAENTKSTEVTGQLSDVEASEDDSDDALVRLNGEGGAESPPIDAGFKPASLINRWAENNTEERQPFKTPKPKAPPRQVSEGSSMDKLKLIDSFAKDRVSSSDLASDESDGEGQSHAHPPMATAPAMPTVVRDFNARLAQAGSILAKPDASDDEVESPTTSPARHPAPVVETAIPSVPTPIRRSESNVNSIIHKVSRPRRASSEEVTVEVGGRTIVRDMSSPLSKKRKVNDEQPTSSAFGTQLAQRFAKDGPGSGGVRKSNGSATDEDDEEEPAQEPTSELQITSLVSDVDAEMPDVVREAQGALDDNEDVELPQQEDEDDEYIDENEKRSREDANIAAMIAAAEAAAAMPTQKNLKRAKSLLKNNTKSKNATVYLSKPVRTKPVKIAAQFQALSSMIESTSKKPTRGDLESGLNTEDAEERLSLTISKSDFATMKIVGQFNLGFILATRSSSTSDDLFIIDQHASDEKYNFERLQAQTVVQSQRLVRPKKLSLTAVEEEIVMEHKDVLEKNGFIVSIDEEAMVGERCRLVSLPLSDKTVFSISDLEELISILSTEQGVGKDYVPRPSKVRKMFAMRACRSSVMIGKTLNKSQMSKLVGHMGEIEKPWNCPHGRPTMRHLCGLGAWDVDGWREYEDEETDWGAYLKGK